MTGKRLFTKAELRDAVQFAADNGFDLVLLPDGGMRFTTASVEDRDGAVVALEAFKRAQADKGHGRPRH